MSSHSPTIQLSSSYDICAAHKLYRSDWNEKKNRDVFGHCCDLHGHQYKFVIVLEGKINSETGMLINGYETDRIVQEKLLSQVDHKYLNDDISFFKDKLPTAEWIAYWAFHELKDAFPSHVKLKSVRIYETPELYASYQN